MAPTSTWSPCTSSASDEIPPFTDQPQHEHSAWATEFVARYCPWGVGSVQLEVRIGRAEELVPRVAAESGCDLIALGWAQELAPGRAPVVRAALERSHRPVMLVPVRVAPNNGTSRLRVRPTQGAFR